MRFKSPVHVRFKQSAMLLQEQRTVCIKVDVIQSSGLLSDSTVLDETRALARASNKTPFMLLHCCGCLILSVLGTRTLSITFGGLSGIPLTGKNNTLLAEGVSSLGGEISEHRCFLVKSSVRPRPSIVLGRQLALFSG